MTVTGAVAGIESVYQEWYTVRTVPLPAACAVLHLYIYLLNEWREWQPAVIVVVV